VVQWPGPSSSNILPSTAKVKERVEPCLYSHLGLRGML
jgi:hypothetical protein